MDLPYLRLLLLGMGSNCGQPELGVEVGTTVGSVVGTGTGAEVVVSLGVIEDDVPFVTSIMTV